MNKASFIGMPLGFMVVPRPVDLVFVVMLFAAAMSLVGQGVLYASRGGLGIGRAREGSDAILEDIGLKKTDDVVDRGAQDATEHTADMEATQRMTSPRKVRSRVRLTVGMRRVKSRVRLTVGMRRRA